MLLNNAAQRGPGTKQESAKDRTRSLALLIGGTVGAVLLFIGVFSTPTMPPNRETSGRAAPNLGRPAAPNQITSPRSSVTPLLNADVRADETNSDQLSPDDIRGTSQRASESEETSSSSERTKYDTGDPRVPSPQARSVERTGSSRSAVSDPLASYRLNKSTGAPTYAYGSPPVPNTPAELPRSYKGVGFTPNETRLDTAAVKSSIVFVRATDATEAAARTRSAPNSSFEATSLLPPGTRLVARLEAAATTAVKTPVVASIEYNYEHDGMILVPAGATVVGDIQQSSSEGYLNLRFHTLRMPDGREEEIEGTGIALDHGPLKGAVSGKNTGRKLLSQTLSGVGTIAAYVVGAGGAGLSSTVTGGTLLRDRLASNVALAGEQEMTNAAYRQNISVTVPANTRFYVVLQKAAGRTSTPAPSRIVEAGAPSAEIPTVQELRELMDLRREINRMYQESTNSAPGGSKP
jgi:hypothetical protein